MKLDAAENRESIFTSYQTKAGNGTLIMVSDNY